MGARTALVGAALVVGGIALLGSGRAGVLLPGGPQPLSSSDVHEVQRSCRGAVSWTQALDHVGARITVAGPVVSATYRPDVHGAPTFINVGVDHPDPARFQAIVFGDDRSGFDTPPETAYAAGRICVTGVVQHHKGVAEITVERPDQITR